MHNNKESAWDGRERRVRMHIPRTPKPGVSEAVAWYAIAFAMLGLGLLWWLKP